MPLDSGAEPPHDAEPPLAHRFCGWCATVVESGGAGLAAGAAGVLLVILLSRRMLRSIGSLTAAAKDLGDGDLSSRVDVKGNDEIAELGRTFNSMADALEESECQRRRVVSDVAHELRTPLANIQGHIEAMQDGLLEPDAATLDTVHRQALHLNRLVDDLRLLAESEARGLRLELEPTFPLAEIVRAGDHIVPGRGRTIESVRLDAEIDETLLTALSLDRGPDRAGVD